MELLARLILACGFFLEANDTAAVLTPALIEQRAMELLTAGRQCEAEELLAAYLNQESDLCHFVALLSKEDADAQKWLDAHADYLRERQRVLFLQACFIRSRFNDREASPYFAAVRAIDVMTPIGRCAKYVLELDLGLHQDVPMKRINLCLAVLQGLADSHPKEPTIRWMLGVECRTWDRNAEGVQQYSKLLQVWKPGPVLVHQTYANLLDQVGSFEEALVERRLAVSMEPAGWSFDGLGNTLHNLRRFSEANAAHAKAVELNPNSSSHWTNWGLTLLDAGDFTAAITKCEQATALDPQYWRPYWCWGQCLEAQGKKAEALEKYEQVLSLYPQAGFARARIAKLTMWDSFWQGVRRSYLGSTADWP